MVSYGRKEMRNGRADLDEVTIASPCRASWEKMVGDEKMRFCHQCQLHVYNLSAMDLEEAADLISRNDDRLCIRFYRRKDGTILTRDCPAGLRAQERKKGLFATAIAAAGSTLALLTCFRPQPHMGDSAPRPVVTEKATPKSRLAGPGIALYREPLTEVVGQYSSPNWDKPDSTHDRQRPPGFEADP